MQLLLFFFMHLNLRLRFNGWYDSGGIGVYGTRYRCVHALLYRTIMYDTVPVRCTSAVCMVYDNVVGMKDKV